MKRVLSLIVVLSIVLSAFCGIQFFSTALQSDSEALTQIDFDYELENGYTYGKVEDDQAAYPAFVSDNGNSVYALYLTRPMNQAPHRTYPLRDSKGNNKPIVLEYGKDYKITLDYKNVSTSQNYIIGVYWCESLEAAKNGAASFDNKAWIYDEITGVVGSTAVSGWKTASQIITPPNETNVYPAIIAFGDSIKNKTEKIYFDNIKVENYEYKTLNTIDFDYEAAGNYNPKYYYKETNAGCISTDTFKKIGENSVYGVYLTRTIGSGGHRLYALRDTETNEPIALKYGKEYNFSFSYNCVKTPVGLRVAIFWVRDPSKASNSDLISDCVQDVEGIIITDNKWKTAKGTISPIKKGYMYPVFAVYNDYGIYGNAGDKVELYFDDMTINEISDKTYNNIDFNYEATGDYPYCYDEKAAGQNPLTYPSFFNLNDGAHKNVYALYLTRPSTENGHRAYLLRDSNAADNSPLKLTYGKDYKFTVSYKNISSGWDYSVCIYWFKSPDAVKSGAPAFNNNPELIDEIAGVTKSRNEGVWQTVSHVCTPPNEAALYPALVVFSGGQMYRTETIYFDDIIVEDYEYKTSNTIDFDYELAGNYGSQYYHTEKNAECVDGFSTFKNLNDGIHDSVYGIFVTQKPNAGTHRLYALRDTETGEPLALKYGEKYNITLDYKRVSTTADVVVAIYWMRDPSSAYNSTLLSKYAEDIVPIGINASKGWNTVSSVISPIKKGYMYPVLAVYSNYGTYKKEEIYFDNIEVINSKSIVINYDTDTTVDFDSNSQPEFFSSENSNRTYKLLGDNNANFQYYDEAHKTVAVIDRINSSTSVGKHENTVSRTRTIGLCNSEGTKFANVEPGKLLNVSVDVNVKNCTIDKLYVGIAFADGNKYGAGDIGKCAQYGGLYSLNAERMLLEVGSLETIVTGWQTVSGTVAVPEHTMSETAWVVLYSKIEFDAMYLASQENILVDNIRAAVGGNANLLSLDETGGKEVSDIYYAPGQSAVYPDAPSREGYDFLGWYYDSACKNEYDYTSPMPDGDMTLYAKWYEYPENFAAKSLETGFEKSDYINNTLPYTNNYKNSEVSAGNVTDDINSYTATVYEESKEAAYKGEGYLEIDNRFNDWGELSKTNSVALLNSDGSNFYLVKGERYHIRFATQHISSRMGADTAELNLVVSSYTPLSGLSNVNSKVISTFVLGSDEANENSVVKNKWGYFEAWFEASVTGRAYFTFANTERPTNSLVTGCNSTAVKIDELLIEADYDKSVTKITYKSHDNKTVFATQYAKAGSSVKTAAFATSLYGMVFNGWRLADKTIFNFNRIPDKDVVIYASYKDEVVNNTTDWRKPLVCDFEYSEDAEAFYSDGRNLNKTELAGMEYVTGDSKNAHSGNGYFKFNKNKDTVLFKPFTDKTPDNYVWLDSNSEYLVTYYVNLFDISASLRTEITAGILPSAGTKANFSSTDVYRLWATDEQNCWKKVVQRITTLDNKGVLAIEMERGPATVLIDDITVEKLLPVTVSFNSNGGSAVQSAKIGAMSYIVEPEYPKKEGYIFSGWYTDKTLTKAFDFNKTYIKDDITLWAKWVTASVSDEKSTPEKQYKTVYDTEYKTEIVENDLSKYGINNAPVIISPDAVLATPDAPLVKEVNSFEWWWIVIAAAVLLAVIIVLIIVVRRKRLKING